MSRDSEVPVTLEEADVAAELLRSKLEDAMTPGFVVDLDPAEAEQAGAFFEDALSEAEALESVLDLVNDGGEG